MITARAVMTAKVVTARRDTDIYEAIRIMVDNDISGLPVVNDDQTLAGIITEKDVLKLLYNFEDRPGKVEDFMTKTIVCFSPEDSLDEITENLCRNRYRRVPILDNGRLVGIISRKDIISYMRQQAMIVKVVSQQFGRSE
jgi:CBS domain-containing protein